MIIAWVLGVVLAAVQVPDLAAAAKPQDDAPLPKNQELLPNEWDLEIVPDRMMFRPYLADPRQPRSGTKVQFPLRSSEDSNISIENALGGFRSIARWTDPHRPEREMGLIFGAAVFSRFDVQEGWDMDAADYRFGFPFLFRDGDLTLKFELWHLTSHLGDEYISREGRTRDSYHLDEFSAAAVVQLSPEWRAYTEFGIGVYTGPATESGRGQAGFEWLQGAEVGSLAPFLAVDFQTRKEIGWSWNGSVAAGLRIVPASGGNGLRFFAEFYRGHDQQTQFKDDLDHYYSFGVAADF